MKTKFSEYKEHYYKLEEFARNEFDVNIVLDSIYEDYFYEMISLITIGKKQNWRGRYYSLLHEIGHLIISKDNDYRETYYPLGKQHYIHANHNSKKAYISLVFEELDAWKLGLLYVKNKGLIYDLEYYHKIMTENVMSHALYGIKKLYF